MNRASLDDAECGSRRAHCRRRRIVSGLKENGLSFVYGVEGDWSWLGGVKLSEGNAELSRSFDVRWVATLRGRAGLAFDATLVYITGGLALGGVDNSLIANIDDGGLTGSFIDDKTRLGWTAGVGCLAASCGRAARQLCPRFPCVRSCRSRCSPRSWDRPPPRDGQRLPGRRHSCRPTSESDVVKRWVPSPMAGRRQPLLQKTQ